MIRRALALLLAAAAPAFAQPPGAPSPAPVATALGIGDQSFGPGDIVDARAIPDMEGPPVIMLTLNDAGMQKLERATREAQSGGTVMVPIIVDGVKVTDLVTNGVRSDAVLTFSARGRTIEQATAIAKRISGRDPLPEDISE